MLTDVERAKLAKQGQLPDRYNLILSLSTRCCLLG